MMEAGVRHAIGSDGPLNPFLGIYFAVTHPLRPEEAVDVPTAVRAYTAGSAHAELEAHEKGFLAPGYLADLAVLSQDIFTIDPELIPDTTSALTIVAGRLEYRSLEGVDQFPSAMPVSQFTDAMRELDSTRASPSCTI